MLRMKYDVRDIPNAEFEPIVAQKFLTLHSLAIDECAVFASLIDNVKFAILRRNDGVLAGDSWVRDHQVSINFAPNGKRRVVKNNRPLIITLNKNEGRKDSGTVFRQRY